MTFEKNQQFENLIDAMMIEEVAGLDSTLKTKLQGLPIDKKRIGILSILDKDRGLFMKIHNQINNSNFNKTDHIKNVVEMLREYVKVGEVEKKTLGEVMTPISLVNDMLDTLPAEVWKNPDLKWLDPCGGCGIFSSVIIERLMINLDISESDEERYRHIVENMLYVCELQPKNMFLHLVSFDPRDEYDLNIYCGSFLDEGFDNHMKDVWGLDKFDVVVMNPPYQTNKEGNRKSQPLWHLFVQKTISQLVEGGYLVAVHPSGWRNIDGIFKNTQKLLKSKEITYLEMHNAQDGLKTFNATTSYDFYCIRNKENKSFITTIKTQDGYLEKMDITNMEFIPNGQFNEIAKLLAKKGEEKVKILYSRSTYGTDKANMSKEQTEEFIYPCVYSILTNGRINWFYSNNKKEFFGIKKLILGNGANPTSFIDKNGDYGITQFAYGIVDEVSNLEKIELVLKSNKFKSINKNTKFVSTNGNPLAYPKIIATFRKDFYNDFI